MRWTWTPEARQEPLVDDDPDRGSAIVEFIGLGLLLLIPVIYLVVTVARVQAASFAVVAAAEQAGQAISVLEAKDVDRTGIHDVAAVAAQDHGFAPQDLTVTVDCSDGTCASPGAVARVPRASAWACRACPDSRRPRSRTCRRTSP